MPREPGEMEEEREHMPVILTNMCESTLFVTNLTKSVTLEHVREMFSHFGKVDDVEISRLGTPPHPPSLSNRCLRTAIATARRRPT